MAATELNGHEGCIKAGAQTRAWLLTYGALWTAALVIALLTALTPEVKTIVRELLSLRAQPLPAPPPSPLHALALAAHNLPMIAWPLLLGVRGGQRSPHGRRAADRLVLAVLLANVIPVGAALGADGLRLLPFLPQVPIEWAAFALGASSWAIRRRGDVRVWTRAKLLLVLTALVLCAAVLEIWAVPVRQARGSTISNTRGLPDRESSRGAQAGSRVLPAWGLTEIWTLGGPEGWNSGPGLTLPTGLKSRQFWSQVLCIRTESVASQRFRANATRTSRGGARQAMRDESLRRRQP
jgi:hypothetical protein